MVTEAHIEKHTPNGVIPFWFVWSFIFACLIGAVLYFGLVGYAYRWTDPSRNLLNLLILVAVGGLAVAWFVGGNARNRDTMAEEWARYKEIDRIGYQLIHMLNSQEELDNRLERRDHQNAQLNTSTYALYVQLGGKRPRVFVGKKRDSSPYVQEVEWLRVSQFQRGESVRVRSSLGPLDTVVSYRTLLKTLNETDGEFGSTALATLLAKLSAERYALTGRTKSYENLRVIVDKITEERNQGNARLADLARQLGLAKYASNVLTIRLDGTESTLSDAVAFLTQVKGMMEKRSTRLTDVGSLIGEKLAGYGERRAATAREQ